VQSGINFLFLVKLMKNIPDDIRRKYPDIAWKDMAGMRDILTHAYYRTDLNLLYTASVKRIPVERAHSVKVYEELKNR
jgi:uncharacterized protein with HEPN domain